MKLKLTTVLLSITVIAGCATKPTSTKKSVILISAEGQEEQSREMQNNILTIHSCKKVTDDSEIGYKLVCEYQH